jgi:hypothetical protein
MRSNCDLQIAKQLYRFIQTKIGIFSILETFKSFSQIRKIDCFVRVPFLGVSFRNNGNISFKPSCWVHKYKQ